MHFFSDACHIIAGRRKQAPLSSRCGASRTGKQRGWTMSGGCADSRAVSTEAYDALSAPPPPPPPPHGDHSRAGDQDHPGRTRVVRLSRKRKCETGGRKGKGCGRKNLCFVIPTDVTKEVKELWRLTGPTGRFDPWPGPRPHPGEYYRGLRHWNPEAPLPPHNATLSAEEYAQGSTTCARPYTWCDTCRRFLTADAHRDETCLPAFGNIVFADPPLQADGLAAHEDTPAHRISFLYDKIMSSSATQEQRAQFAELEVSKDRDFKGDALQVVNAACERVKTHYAEHDAAGYFNVNGDVSPGESVGSAQVVSSRCAFAVRNW